MTDKIKSADFIQAFGSGVSAKVENVPMKLEVNSPIVIDCKYYLPCGRCDKTNGFCSQLDEIGKDCMDEDAKQASVPYTYNTPQHDWKCGYPDIARGEEEGKNG
jgi:hypothetical protein